MLRQERFQTENPNVMDTGESSPSRPNRQLQRMETETILPRQRARQSNCNNSYPRSGNKGELAKGIPLRLDNELDVGNDDRSFYDDDENYNEQQGLFRDEDHDDDEDESGIVQARLFANAMLYESEKRQNSKRNLFRSSLVKRMSSFRSSNHSGRSSSLRTIGRSSSHRSIPMGSNSSDKNIWLVDEQDERHDRSQKTVCVMVVVVVTLLVGMLFAVTISQWQTTKRFRNTNSAENQNNNRLENILEYLGQEISSREDLSNTDSPQYKAAVWLSHDDDHSEVLSRVHLELVQRYVLLVLYFSLGNNNHWTKNYHFASHEHHECSWFERVLDLTEPLSEDGLSSAEPRYLAMGVSCDNELRVTSIALRKYPNV